ncbi:type 1 glutamine amidotransferase [Roseateles depolymerans]|uniref:GMP synthase family protein n=1 Tax=Roseateles depolymerans TaxID=76731 RepID=A0A0U3MEP2_9BURK|nr:type 1 glutamine amidotransferase [Roseateles depolymerans]ALV07181.1 GMP synthase family protein [Roseateles depolymerans]REG20164.1 GMP synthase-like glutamine amidotransferase [Roseateles depolymerans]
MRPVLILQHEPAQGPGYLLQCLREHGLDVELLRPDLGDRPPAYAGDFSGLVLLGSDHSVQDHLPWIARERLLLADALRLGRPVLGHCFGAQQLARTLGAPVHRNPRPDIGWRELWITPAARHLFDGQDRLLSFNWHHDSFQMPPGATRTLFGVHNLNKGFALGPHLGLQSHLEVTDPGLRAWCAQGRAELAQCHGPTVQTEQEILADLPERLARLRRAARAVYHHWIGHLDRRPVFVRPRAA